MKYYLDTCIWINLFKKEVNIITNKEYWKITQIFLDKVLNQNDQIFYSGIILREIQIKLGDDRLKDKSEFFYDLGIIKIELIQEDKILARKLESKYNFEISFYDLLHLSICKRLDFILVTRDRQLINIAKENDVKVIKPEWL